MNHMDMMEIKNKQKGDPLIFRLEDGSFIIDGLEGNAIILNQDKQLGYAIRPNNSPYTHEGNKYEMITFPYDAVASVTSYTDIEGINTLLDQLTSDGAITDEYRESILESVVINKNILNK